MFKTLYSPILYLILFAQHGSSIPIQNPRSTIELSTEPEASSDIPVSIDNATTQVTKTTLPQTTTTTTTSAMLNNKTIPSESSSALQTTFSITNKPHKITLEIQQTTTPMATQPVSTRTTHHKRKPALIRLKSTCSPSTEKVIKTMQASSHTMIPESTITPPSPKLAETTITGTKKQVILGGQHIKSTKALRRTSTSATTSHSARSTNASTTHTPSSTGPLSTIVAKAKHLKRAEQTTPSTTTTTATERTTPSTTTTTATERTTPSTTTTTATERTTPSTTTTTEAITTTTTTTDKTTPLTTKTTTTQDTSPSETATTTTEGTAPSTTRTRTVSDKKISPEMSLLKFSKVTPAQSPTTTTTTTRMEIITKPKHHKKERLKIVEKKIRNHKHPVIHSKNRRYKLRHNHVNHLRQNKHEQNRKHQRPKRLNHHRHVKNCSC